ncbi:hypothetical protein A1O3_06180 [Capronia epimyces CBS 606.96]|uniref:C2H2-type domain-containing protein n=1 Tax=Capronia epimyces CBS 606.96 TaxID=1182542 RepID=W9XPD0_9EURO|nr:uncharacterized protein A1O3_06180 [Capronia epimyces CBS 606.96]EXJ82367.1 hypothetical protein A1O3_06180 [Capronia epimyces CBS 606.96]
MSNDQDPNDYSVYNLERDFLQPSRTPPLEATRPILIPQPSPRPLVPYYPSSESSDEESTHAHGARSSRARRIRKGRTTPTLGDGVLITSLDPNLVEVANRAERHALASASQSEAEEEEIDDGGGQESKGEDDTIASPRQVTRRSFVYPKSITPEIRTNTQDDFPMIDGSPESLTNEEPLHSPIATSQHVPDSSRFALDRGTGHLSHHDMPKRTWDVRPPPRSPPRLRLLLEAGRQDEESLVTSPTLGRYTITPQDVDPDVILPAMQKSPPMSSPAASPRPKLTLPSLRTTIGNIPEHGSAVFPSISPGLSRPSPSSLHQYRTSPSFQSPKSVMSPPDPPTHNSFRTATRDSSISTASEITLATVATTSTPVTSEWAESPATSTPSLAIVHDLRQRRAPVRQDTSREAKPRTKKTRKPDPEPEESNNESEVAIELPSSDAANSSRVSPAGTYQCTFQGCNAAPFQTQYLLNSHMNVHSDTRTHFCPVKGCRRGPGGEGFKRKNEMIRHGLVHMSPGYACPFCPDQQHRYPRPDNLQRHVRAHHKDRDLDDPALREVLNLRPDGASRGRKRRMRS